MNPAVVSWLINDRLDASSLCQRANLDFIAATVTIELDPYFVLADDWRFYSVASDSRVSNQRTKTVKEVRVVIRLIHLPSGSPFKEMRTTVSTIRFSSV